MENPLNAPQELPLRDQDSSPPAKKQWIKPEMTTLTLRLNAGPMMDGEAQQPSFPS